MVDREFSCLGSDLALPSGCCLCMARSCCSWSVLLAVWSFVTDLSHFGSSTSPLIGCFRFNLNRTVLLEVLCTTLYRIFATSPRLIQLAAAGSGTQIFECLRPESLTKIRQLKKFRPCLTGLGVSRMLRFSTLPVEVWRLSHLSDWCSAISKSQLFVA